MAFTIKYEIGKKVYLVADNEMVGQIKGIIHYKKDFAYLVVFNNLEPHEVSEFQITDEKEL